MLLTSKLISHCLRSARTDRLVHVPNVEPPLAIDWQVGPTHPVHHVPYQLAQYWDKGLRERVEERKAAFASASRRRGKAGSKTMPETGRVPRELRETAKRAPAVKGWLRVLEEPVRRFLVERGAAVDQTAEEKPEAAGETDSDDEEIVFTGRKSLAERDQNSWKKARKEGPGHEAEPVMVLDSPADDETSAFKYVSITSLMATGPYPSAFSTLTPFRLQALAHSLHL